MVNETLRSNLLSVRKDIYQKSSDLVKGSRFDWDIQTSKAVNLALSKIKSSDDIDSWFYLDCAEYYMITNTKSHNLQYVKEVFKRAADNSCWVIKESDPVFEKESSVLVRVFDEVELHTERGKGTLAFTFHKSIKPYITQLVEKCKETGKPFIRIANEEVMLMKSQYSIRLYELLQCYSNRDSWEFELGTGSKHDLKLIMTPLDDDQNPITKKSWKDNSAFLKDVIYPAVEEINKYTRLKIFTKTHKYDLAGNPMGKITMIEFVMMNKLERDIRETEKIIDEIYEAELKERYGVNYKNNLNEEEIRKYKEAIEKERKEKSEKKEAAKKKEYESRIKNSKHPMLTEMLYDTFADYEITNLYEEAVSHMDPEISASQCEMFASDYISYYFRKIKESSEKTVTTIFKRLMNELKKDYDGMLPKFNMQHIKQSYGVIDENADFKTLDSSESDNINEGVIEEQKNVVDEKVNVDGKEEGYGNIEQTLMDLIK